MVPNFLVSLQRFSPLAGHGVTAATHQCQHKQLQCRGDALQSCATELESIQTAAPNSSKQGLVKKVEQIIMICLFNAAERRTSKIVLS